MNSWAGTVPDAVRLGQVCDSGIRFLVLIGMSAAIFCSLLGISRTRALFSALAENVISYILIFTSHTTGNNSIFSNIPPLKNAFRNGGYVVRTAHRIEMNGRYTSHDQFPALGFGPLDTHLAHRFVVRRAFYCPG